MVGGYGQSPEKVRTTFGHKCWSFRLSSFVIIRKDAEAFPSRYRGIWRPLIRALSKQNDPDSGVASPARKNARRSSLSAT